MEIRQLKTLVSIVDFGGFAAAGEVLGLTQSAISLQIKALERELGEELFDRTKRPPRASAHALSIARKAREILRLCDDLTDTPEQSYAGSLHLGAVPSVQGVFLPQALKQLLNSYPDLFIHVHTGLSSELTRSVSRGVIDAAIVSEPQKLPMGLEWYPIASESLVVIAHPDAQGDNPHELLASNPYIRFKRSSLAGSFIESELKHMGIMINPVLETDNIDSIWQFVAAGIGVSVMPQHATNSANADEQLQKSLNPNHIKVCPLNEKGADLVTGLVTRSAAPNAHLLEALVKTLQP